MKNCSMNYVNVAESKWEKCTLEEIQFQRAFFSTVTLKKTTMTGMNFKGVDFYKTSLAGYDLTDANLEEIILSDDLKELQGAKVNMFQAAELITKLGIKVI